MRYFTLAALAALVSVAVAAAQDSFSEPRLLDYQEETDWIPETPGTTSGAPGGFINPAAWSTLQAGRPEFAFWWNDRSVKSGLDNWGASTSGWLGLGVNSQVFEVGDRTYRVTDWQLGISGGDRNARLGLAYRWRADGAEAFGRENALVVGLLSRPNRLISLGAVGTWSTRSRARYGVFDLGLRPLGNDRITLYGDVTYTTLDRWEDGRWGAGVTVKPFRGVHLGATAREETGTGKVRWIANVGLNLNDLGFHWLPSWNSDGDLRANTFLARSNPPTRNVANEFRIFDRDTERFAVLDLENRYLTYQQYRYFDERRVAWLQLASYLDAVAADPRLDGLVLNLFDFVGRPSLIWELRQRLTALQESGKEIVVLCGRLDIGRLYLASVADHLWIDPEGDVVLQGVASGRTYFRDMLDKLGLGYQELRYFKYKSAAEGGARMDMSPGEREQRQRMVDVIYEEYRGAICASRRIGSERFDELVDSTVGLTPGQARDLGLVDAVGRRAELLEWLRRDRRVEFAAPHVAYRPHSFPEEHWSEPDQVAVVYAVGGCLMDAGIEGRATARYLNSLVDNAAIKAVVLRADSPGGDPLPSDLVAGAMRRLREAGKPVIVSQGDVAASGGYWISMDGAEILTTPLTVTGSIGVIGAWIYADEVSEKTGLAYDGVKRGEHADLLRPLRDPFLGIGLPHRALDEQELDLARRYILEAYDDFVGQVAEARELSEEQVREVAQGRVWMGADAIGHRLCDRLGGLDAAIAAARERAGLGPEREVELVEYPPRPLIDLSALLGRSGSPLGFPFGVLAPVEDAYARLAAAAPWRSQPELPPGEAMALEDFDYARWYLESLDGRLGRPRAILAPEVLPEGWGRPE
jgi:protease-4